MMRVKMTRLMPHNFRRSLEPENLFYNKSEAPTAAVPKYSLWFCPLNESDAIKQGAQPQLHLKARFLKLKQFSPTP